MKIGDLVRCIFQPKVSRIENGCAMPMEHHINGEMGIILRIRSTRQFRVMFPQFGYTHTIAHNGLELVSGELSDEDLENVHGGMSEKSFDNGDVG